MSRNDGSSSSSGGRNNGSSGSNGSGSDRSRAEQEARERAEQAAREKAERERSEQAAREKAEKERAAQAAREKAEKERAAQAAREKAERERAEQAARDKAEKERAEQAARDKAEKERAAQAARDKAEKERAAQAAREKAEKEARDRAERERANADKDHDDDQGTWTDLAIGRVSASGAGCANGTWKAQIDSSGHGFDVQFTELATDISPTQKESSVRCRLTVVVPTSKGGVSYRVGRFTYSGYTYLEKGMSAEFTTAYAFAGVPESAFNVQTKLEGPLDKEYTVTDDIDGEAGWSPCSSSGTLNVDVTVKLTNGASRVDGVLEVAGASGLSLETRACD